MVFSLRALNDKSLTRLHRIYDPDPGPPSAPAPGKLPPALDPQLRIPDNLPTTTLPSRQERYQTTPIYSELITNVPDIAMSFSDCPFAYGPFAPHWVPKQNVQDYFSRQRTDNLLALNTAVEDISKLKNERWSLTLRRFDSTLQRDLWWREDYDALVLCNGHYSVPYVPHVDGLLDYMERFPGKVMHSKGYRSASAFAGRKVVVVGNSASGFDITTLLTPAVHSPVYQSRRSRSRWDGDSPPPGVEWKPVISKFCAKSGDIVFVDGSIMRAADVDHVIYCTGYKPSFPYWNSKQNGGPLWDYQANRLAGSYLHTFFSENPTLGLVGMPRTLTFRSFEYQAIALARVFAGREAKPLPDKAGMRQWQNDRDASIVGTRKMFHDIPCDNGETLEYFTSLYEIAGLPGIRGDGKCPPILDSATVWALQHIKKYPEPEQGSSTRDMKTFMSRQDLDGVGGWVIVEEETQKDSLHFI